MMSYLNSEPAGVDVYLSSPAPASVNRGYHRIQGWVKRNAPTATFGAGAKPTGWAKRTIYKLPYQLRGSLSLNDEGTPRQARRS